MRRQDGSWQRALLPVLVIALVLGIVGLGCSPEALVDRFANEEMKELAVERVEALRTGDGSETFAQFDAEFRNEGAEATLHRLAEIFPDEDYVKRSVIGYQWQRLHGTKFHNFTIEYEIGGKFWVANIILRENGAETTTYGLHLHQQEASTLAVTSVDFTHASVLHYLVLAAAIALPIASLVSIVVCVRTRGFPRKWLWSLFMLFGFGGLELNWSTGAIHWSIFSIKLLSADASANFGGPWVVGIAMPVGVFLFWEKRRKLRMENAESLKTTQSNPENSEVMSESEVNPSSEKPS